MKIPVLYRDSNGNRLTITQLLRAPGAWECRHGYALDPEPKQPHVIGSKDGMPVILMTDVGAALDDGDGPYRQTTFRIPGDDRLHELCIAIPCTIPIRHRGNCYIVHEVTRETLAAMDPQHCGQRRRRRLRDAFRTVAGLIARLGGLIAIPYIADSARNAR